MTASFVKYTHLFQTPLDFLRFGVSQANAAGLYYGHGTDNSWDDILTLILRSLHLPIDMNPMLLHARLTPNECDLLTRQLEKRILGRIPVPYLTHEAYFCDLSFYVDERVLIPRSPIAELIKEHFSPWIDKENVIRILDLCTGSGCIAIACSYAFPQSLIDAVDISADALAIAMRNVKQHNSEQNVCLIESDCFSKLSGERYDIIVSNPPYVSFEEMQTLPDEYLQEPKLALEAADQGLAIVERIMKDAYHHLTPEGILVVEVGNSQESLLQRYPQVPFTWLEFESGGEGVFLLTASQLASCQF